MAGPGKQRRKTARRIERQLRAYEAFKRAQRQRDQKGLIWDRMPSIRMMNQVSKQRIVERFG